MDLAGAPLTRSCVRSDNALYLFGMRERQRSRVESAGRVDMSAEEQYCLYLSRRTISSRSWCQSWASASSAPTIGSTTTCRSGGCRRSSTSMFAAFLFSGVADVMKRRDLLAVASREEDGETESLSTYVCKSCRCRGI